jgi:rubredoxin
MVLRFFSYRWMCPECGLKKAAKQKQVFENKQKGQRKLFDE